MAEIEAGVTAGYFALSAIAIEESVGVTQSDWHDRNRWDIAMAASAIAYNRVESAVPCGSGPGGAAISGRHNPISRLLPRSFLLDISDGWVGRVLGGLTLGDTQVRPIPWRAITAAKR